jgi:hypothetical protein
MDREEKDALLGKIDEILDGSREGRVVKEIVERLPTEEEQQQDPTPSAARDARVAPRFERHPG